MASDFEIKQKILGYLRNREQGACASDIAKSISFNRITVGKYLLVLEAEKAVVPRKVASAIFWQLTSFATKPKVLVADDEKVIVDLIRLSLTPRYSVFEAFDGEEALQKAKALIPDVLVLDIMMPKKDGIEVCKELKSQASTQNIIIVVVSAKGQPQDKVAMLNIGADDYITKPFDPFELEARIESILQKKQTLSAKHPITGLPSTFVTDQTASAWGLKKSTWFELRIQLGNVEENASVLGQRKVHDILKLFTRMLLEQLAISAPDGYVGHISENTFVVFSDRPLTKLSQSVSQNFSELCTFVYAEYEGQGNKIVVGGKALHSLTVLLNEVKHE